MTFFGRLAARLDRLPHLVALLLCLALIAAVGAVGAPIRPSGALTSRIVFT